MINCWFNLRMQLDAWTWIQENKGRLLHDLYSSATGGFSLNEYYFRQITKHIITIKWHKEFSLPLSTWYEDVLMEACIHIPVGCRIRNGNTEWWRWWFFVYVSVQSWCEYCNIIGGYKASEQRIQWICMYMLHHFSVWNKYVRVITPYTCSVTIQLAAFIRLLNICIIFQHHKSTVFSKCSFTWKETFKYGWSWITNQCFHLSYEE